MKVSELMIGDWAYNKHHKKPIQITPHDFFTHSHKGGVQSFEGVLIPKPTLGRDLSPIPLTEEILKANGFHQLDEVDYEYVYSRDDVTFCVCKRDLTCPYIRFGGYFFCNTNYVHELQRVLRCCGLSELADNFKVE